MCKVVYQSLGYVSIVAYYMCVKPNDTKQDPNDTFAALFGAKFCRTLFFALLLRHVVMLCLSAWLGALPTCHVNKLKVYSKLGGSFLGFVDKPCLQNQVGSLIFYDTLRSLQDQVALIFKHEFLASKHIVVYVGTGRLTRPDFPFVVSFEGQAQAAGALQSAQSVSVMYDVDLEAARASLEDRGLSAYKIGNVLTGRRTKTLKHSRPRMAVLALPELDAWAFHYHVEHIQIFYEAKRIGSLASFPYLKSLDGTVSKADFKRLATTCKRLERVWLHMDAPCTLLGVGELSNLQRLSMHYFKDGDVIYICHNGVSLPSEIGNLSNLTALTLEGRPFCGCIPTEIGKLQNLKRLVLRATSLTHTVPTELGALANLKYLDFQHSRLLSGHMPDLSHLQHLEGVSLFDTPNLIKDATKLPHSVW